MRFSEFSRPLTEAASPRIPHPEDAIFGGVAEASKYLTGLKEVIANPGGVTIKWDGGIALVFGNGDGGFTIADKYMPEKGFYPRSPEDWIRYDQDRGKDRADLYDKIKLIWPGLQAAVGNTKGLFKGDLMSVGQLTPIDGKFVFSPTTVEYKVPVDSALGQTIAKSVAIVAVHMFNGAPWDGKTGITGKGNVAILTPSAGIEFTIKNPTQLVGAADSALKSYGAAAEQFLAGMTGAAKEAIKTYFNRQITKQTNKNIVEWLRENAPPTFKKLIGDANDGYLMQNQDAYKGLVAIWNAVYALKCNLAAQLEPQVAGFEQTIKGQPAGEGFVFNSKTAGMIKLVNREVFGGAHFNK
jgi:hypothetical protein